MIKLKVDTDGQCSLTCQMTKRNGCKLDWAIIKSRQDGCAGIYPDAQCPLYGQCDAEFEFDPRDT